MPAVKVIHYDEDAQEAIVEIQTSLNAAASSMVSRIVFCSTICAAEDNKKVLLFGFRVTNIVCEKVIKAPQKTNRGYFSYRLFARVIDPQIRRVQFGGIDIVLDCPIPEDISQNSCISFDVMRLDLR